MLTPFQLGMALESSDPVSQPEYITILNRLPTYDAIVEFNDGAFSSALLAGRFEMQAKHLLP
jgi:hypothetical protein